MIEVNSEQRVTITTTAPSPALDAWVLPIQQFLMDRLAPGYEHGLPDGDAGVRIDLGVLGLRTEGESVSRTWGSEVVYPIRLSPTSVLLGPVFRPARGCGPCPCCLERGWLALRPREVQQAFETYEQIQVCDAHPLLTPWALESIWALVEMQLGQRSASGAEQGSEGQFFVLDLTSLQLSRSQVIADPSCPVCATLQPDTPEQAEISLFSRHKRAVSDYHPIKVTAYTLPITGYLNPICGLLGTASYPDYAQPLNARVRGRFPVRVGHALIEAAWAGHANHYDHSLRLGLLEGLERFAGQKPRGKTVAVVDSYEHLRPIALDPLDCGVYSADFYRMAFPTFAPFRTDQPIPWVWGYSFRQARPMLVSEYLAYCLDIREGTPPFVLPSYSGCATGGSLEEAILFGLLELIERDAFLLAWYARLALPRIDPWSCHRPELLHLLDRIDRLGYEIILLDTRLDLPLPSVLAVAVRRDGGLGTLVVAAGSGLEPEDAIEGAVGEVASSLPNFSERVEKNLDAARAMARDYRLVTQPEHHPLLYGLPEMASQAAFLWQNPRLAPLDVCYEAWMQVRPRSSDLRDDVQYCIERVLKLGLDVIVVDQTSPAQARVGLAGARVIVPGLLPLDFGWGRERVFDLPRLRTVPRTAGFLDTEFNPASSERTPHPFR